MPTAADATDVSLSPNAADARPGHRERVLLVDDVLTTGATVTLCSSLLRRSGAVSVTVLTLARVDRRPAEGRAAMTALRATGGAR